MSINLALESALSGLLTSQKALDVISNNVSNLNTPGYTRKVLIETNNVVNGVGAGVKTQSIQRSVDQGLTNELQSANGTLTQYTTADSYYSQMQNMFGTPSDQSSISSLIQNLANAVQTMEATPGQSVTGITNAASQVTGSLQTMSGKVQSSRAAADQQIGTAVAAVNTALTNIANLNNQIATNGVNGASTDDLKDQRDSQLKTLASYLNFVSFDRPDGSLSLYTNQGTPLLDAQAQTVIHNSSAAVEPRMTFDAASGTGALQGISVNGQDISNQITNGSLAALLQVRDSVLPNLQSQLDTLAQALQTNLNQVNNQGTSWPTGGQSFTGTRSFIDPSQQRLSITGGDTSVVLVNADGSEKARTTVSTVMQGYLQNAGIPLTDGYSVTQLADGMNGWLNQQFNTTGMTYAQVTPAGQLGIQLPQTSTVSLAFRDQQTQQFESGIYSDNLTSGNGGKAMNVTGPLTFRDTAGNVYSTTVAASDSLQDVANKINSLGGLTASLTAVNGTSQPQLYQLQVTNNAGYNMTVDPDPANAGASVVSGLGINPSRSQPAGDVAINFNGDGTGTSFTSAGYTSATTQCNVAGELTFRDSSGQLAQIQVSATDSLATIARNINNANPRSLNASVSTIGNQARLVVTDLAGNQLSIDGSTGGYQSTPVAAFTSVGTALTMTSGGSSNTVNFPAGSNLAAIASAINTNAVVTNAGIKASVGTDGTNSWLTVTNASGLPVTFSGNATGNGANLLKLNLNPADALGLAPPPDQTVQGFSNFFGLNDLLVTGQPTTTFESQTLTSNFTTTASNLDLSSAEWVNGDPSTGGLQSFNLNFAAGSTLSSIAKQINAQAVTYDSTHLQLGAFKAQAGTLTVGNGIVPMGSIAVNAGDTLSTVAANLNANSALSAAGVRAIVATDGTNQWLRVYDQQGSKLNFSGTADGPLAGQLTFGTNQLVTAAIAVDGSGQRLRVYSNNNKTLQVTGSLTAQTNMAAADVGISTYLGVRPDIQNTPALMSRGTVQYDSGKNQYYLGTTDVTSLQNMYAALTNATTIPLAGGLGQGAYSLSQYGAAIVSNNAANASNNKTQMTYQQTLVNSLSTQQAAVSGVNLDEELSNLITYQQSYSAAAKVISTVQQLFTVLNGIVQ